MNPALGCMLIILLLFVLGILFAPAFIQSREMFKGTQNKWDQEEDDVEKLSRLVANLKEETDLLDHRRDE